MSDLPVNITGNVPDKTMGRLGEAIADLISPITETSGLVGDSIRFHREEMAKRRVAKAREKAANLGVEVKKLPYKFMVNWLDAATLENEDSTLNDLWENLLVAGMTSYHNYLEMFVSILKELGGSEVYILKVLADRTGTLDTGSWLVPSKGRESEFPPAFQSALKGIETAHEFWSTILKTHDDQPGGMGFQLVGGIASKDGGQSYYYHPLYMENDVAFELLSRERLVDISKSRAPIQFEGAEFYVLTARLTQLGISFVRACMYPETLKPVAE